VLPYSTADLERNFSTAGIIKNDQRNRLSSDRLEACLLAKQYFGKNDQYYTEEMLNSYLNKSKKEQVEEKLGPSDQGKDLTISELQMSEERTNERCIILLTPSQEETNKMVREIISGHNQEAPIKLKRGPSSPLPTRNSLKLFKPAQEKTNTIQYQKDHENNHKFDMIDEEDYTSNKSY